MLPGDPEDSRSPELRSHKNAREARKESSPPATSRPSRPFRYVVLLAVLWGTSTALWLTPGITRPDGVGYYAYLPSTWLDRDLLFFNEWQETGMIVNGRIAYKEVTGTGHLGNHWGPGSAVYWYPAFVAADALRSTIPSLRRYARNGFSLPYNVAVVFASAIAGLATLLVAFAAARQISPDRIAALVAAGIWLGSPLTWYALKNSLTAHAVSALACSVVVLLAMRFRTKQTDARVLAIGLAIGFAVAVRPENAPIVLVPLLLLHEPPLWRSPRRAALLAAGGMIGYLPQLVVNGFLYGSPIPFLARNSSEGMPWAPFEQVHLLAPLVSWYHGLVPWTPFLAFGLVGLGFLWRDDRRLAAAAVSVFAVEWLMNATLDRFFWGGFSFGQRRFDSCTIFFALGAASLLKRLPRWLAIALTSLTSLWTLSLFFAASKTLDLNRYYTPRELAATQLAALTRPATYLRYLSAVPSAARAAVSLVIVVMTIATAIVALLAMRLWRRETLRVGVACAYFAGLSIFFFRCGRNDAARIGEFSGLIAANRRLGASAAWTDTKIGLLRQEFDYLVKTERMREAGDTRREIAALQAVRQRPAGGEGPR